MEENCHSGEIHTSVSEFFIYSAKIHTHTHTNRPVQWKWDTFRKCCLTQTQIHLRWLYVSEREKKTMSSWYLLCISQLAEPPRSLCRCLMCNTQRWLISELQVPMRSVQNGKITQKPSANQAGIGRCSVIYYVYYLARGVKLTDVTPHESSNCFAINVTSFKCKDKTAFIQMYWVTQGFPKWSQS